jgi:hypothetical protein
LNVIRNGIDFDK